jgi:hypothetical protein
VVGLVAAFLFYGVLVEADDGAPVQGDSGPGTSLGFQVAGEAFDIGAAGLEQPEVVVAQIQGVASRVNPV